MMSTEDLKKELLETDEEFRSLHEEHQAHERRLDELQHKTSLSQEDEMEAKQLKLSKLRIKDQMEAILRSRAETGVSG